MKAMIGHEILISAPSRLAFTLIDLSLASDRINGGAGLAIANPKFECKVKANPALEIVVSTDRDFCYLKEVLEFATNLLNEIDGDPVRLEITSSIPSHTGFGSKTATLLTVGRAICFLNEHTMTTASLAQIAHRGGTSGVGVNTFDLGGFVVDGGHAVSGDQFNSSGIFLPSRYSKMKTIPPVLFNSTFPWRLFLIVPKGKTVQGEIELAHFKKVCPFPRSEVHEIAYLTCFKMPTAIFENDYSSFCRTVNSLQQTYWKASQIENQTDELRYVMQNAAAHGFDAIGISSNGPALYGLSESPQHVQEWLAALKRKGIVESFWQTYSREGVQISKA
jgi:beta-ribofuranosylaminobenzene 5'-phosphate synthase